MNADVHFYQKRLESALRRVENSLTITAEDKQTIERFCKVLRIQNISTGRVARYVNNLKVAAEKIVILSKSDRGLTNASKDDVAELSIWLSESEYTPQTRCAYATVLKRFFQWLRALPEEYSKWRKRHIYPAEVEDLSTGVKLSERFLPSDLPTEEEAKKLVDCGSNQMRKASFALEDEIGARPGELLTLRKCDVLFDGDDVMVRLGHRGGKTGERVLYIVKSVSLLSQWLNVHPLRGDMDAPLWLSQSNSNRLCNWSYNAYAKALEETATSVGIRKKIIPYLLRHTAASREARLGWTEVELCQKYGWKLGSRMPRVYIHIAGSDLKRKIQQTYGGKEIVKPRPQTVTCQRCKETNHPSQRFCGRCGLVLDEQELARQSIQLEHQKHLENARVEELERQLEEVQNRLNQTLGLNAWSHATYFFKSLS